MQKKRPLMKGYYSHQRGDDGPLEYMSFLLRNELEVSRRSSFFLPHFPVETTVLLHGNNIEQSWHTMFTISSCNRLSRTTTLVGQPLTT